MKRTIRFLRAASAAFAVALVLGQVGPPRDGTALRAAWAAPAEGIRGSREPFTSLPEGESRRIDCLVPSAVWGRLTAREKADQLRDWTLLTVAGAAGLDANDLARATCDIPTLRHGYLQPLAQAQYGVTRSCHLGDGRVLAVVPKSADEDERCDHLAHVADEYRKTIGQIPRQVVVCEYDLAVEQMRVTVTRRPSVEGKDLFTEAYGYHEETVSDLAGLTRFVTRAPDVTYAAKVDDGVKLGGRKLLSRKYRSLRVEDIAAIWQAGSKLPASFAQGFSLDPQYDFEALTEWFKKEAEPALRELARDKASGITEKEIDQAKFSLSLNRPGSLLTTLGRVREAGRKAEKPEWVRGIEAWSLKLQDFQFQAARYDGDLQGTEVGMVLFYTDLVAKLWCAINLANSAPVNVIDDFRTGLDGRNPAFFREKVVEHPSTRIWFGVEPNGFQLLPEKKGILFARRAARMYSASTDPLQPGAEVPTNPKAQAVFGWWNDHYEEVARYEPEYERLNEFMKWSLIAGWIQEIGAKGSLTFLDGVPVDRSAWFPKWAKHNTDLRFSQWHKIGFHPRGYKETKTETLPLLKSLPFADYGEWQVSWTTSGGVQGGSPHDIQIRAPLPKGAAKAPPGGRGLDHKTSLPDKSTTHRGLEFKFEKGPKGEAVVQATASKEIPLVAHDGEVARTQLTRTLTMGDGGLVIRNRLATADLGELSVRSTTNGFNASHTPLEVERAFEIARSSSFSAPVHGGVEPVIVLAPDRHLKFDTGSNKWVKVTRETTPSASLPETASARVGGDGSFGRGGSHHIAWQSSPETTKALAGYEYLHLQLPAGVDQRLVIRADARGPPKMPPPNSRTLTMEGGGEPEPIKGWVFDSGHTLLLKRADLPKAYQNRPELLAARFKAREGDALAAGVRRAIRDSAKEVKLPFPGGRSAEPVRPLEQASASLSENRASDVLLALNRSEAAGASPTPITRLARAVAEFELLRGDAARRTLGLPEESPLTKQSLGTFLDEATRRMQSPDVPLEEKQLLYAAASRKRKQSAGEPFEDGLPFFPESASRQRQFEAVVVNGEPGLATKQPVLSNRANPRDPKTGDLIYVEDSGKLSTVNWVAAIEKNTLAETLNSHGADLLVIYGAEVRRFRPEQVRTRRLGDSYQGQDRMGVLSGVLARRAAGAAGKVALTTLILATLGVDDEDECDSDDRGLMAASAWPARPARKAKAPCPKAYIILAKSAKGSKAPPTPEDDDD